MAQTRYVCIHGHFYQPPRENPWLETIERQESAYPYPNWNERILAECYRPNAASRIHDDQGRITRIVNNYEKISFNFGPTLLSWLESEAPDVYAAIREADQASQTRFSGHGSAMAQSYNHMIMPLANRRDKVTQVLWGIRDFEHRFGRKPEGMWLAETAVDSETLDIMAEHGIAFTVLAPGQARSIRALDGSTGDIDVTGDRIDPGRTYRARTPSGRTIDLFFYDGIISQAVAFERLLSDGRAFAHRLSSARHASEPFLSHIATDGETYGHHHRLGDMALAYAMKQIEDDPTARLTNYGEFRELFPARYEVEIAESSAWSCVHGVGRWCDDCGCHTGGDPGWNQGWRRPLRDALDWLRDELAVVFETHGGELFGDPWQARDDFIDVVMDRSAGNVDDFLRRHGARRFTPAEESKALQLLEMQRHAMLMYTSCGWFFNDLAGVETVQILRYAARAIELAELVMRDTGQSQSSEQSSGGAPADQSPIDPIEVGFVNRLERAESNRPEYGTGQVIYDNQVLPSKVDLRSVIAHYAVSSLFDDNRQVQRIHCYEMEAEDLRYHEAGKAKLTVGTVRCSSLITRASQALSFGALHLGDHNLTGGVRHFVSPEAYDTMVGDVLAAFDRADLVAAQRELDRHFLELSFSLRSLFPDHRDRVMLRILDRPLADADADYGQIYAHNAPLMRYLASFDLPIPEAFRLAAEYVLRSRMRRALDSDFPNLREMRTCLDQARRVGVEIEDAGLDYRWHQALERLLTRFDSEPGDLEVLEHLGRVAELCVTQQLDVDLWRTQNECYKHLQCTAEQVRRGAVEGDPESERWLALFERLCRTVRIAI